jgi:hypothetical protein
MNGGNMHLDGVKSGKKKKFILEHVMYTHFSDNEFFTFPFYLWQEKEKKNSVEVKKYASFQGQKMEEKK